MFDFITSILRNLATGIFILVLLIYQVSSCAYDRVFREHGIPPGDIAVGELMHDGGRDYARDGKSFEITARLTNNSDLTLRRVEVHYEVYDCLDAGTPRELCVRLGSSSGSDTAEAPPGFPHQFRSSFVLPRMATPRHVLQIDTTFEKFVGM
jgi:hypothetical protein